MRSTSARRRSTSAGALAAIVVGLCASPSHAVDPSLQWYTIETEHFRVHFHEGPNQEAFAQRAARALEAAHARVVAAYGRAPDTRTEVLVTDDVDYSNGSATVFPRQQIHLIADPPDDLSVLNDYDDYLWLLSVHEYAHIVHLDDASGIPQLVNRIFGNVWAPNGQTPRWITEGFATYVESRESAGGRIRSSLFDAWLRALTLERPFRIDEITHNPTRWPRGSLAYLYGGHFLDFVARRAGPQKLREYFRSYGARVFPWALNVVSKETLGEDFVALYAEWQTSLVERYRAQVEQIQAQGITDVRLLTSAGEGTGHPRFSPDGSRVFYVETGADRRAAIRSVAVDGSDDRRELALWSGVHFDLSPDSRRVVFSAGEIHREFNFFEDLYEAELATGEIRRLTRALRATEPDYAPSGSHVAYVGRRGSGTTYLGIFDLRTGGTRALLEATADERIFTPDFSPDGARIAFSQQRGTSRHLREIDVETLQVRDLVASDAMNLQPEYAGDELVFSSDHSGVFNLYSVPLSATGTPRPLTNVVGGVFQPAVSGDGERIAATVLGPRGMDVGLVDASGAPRAPLFGTRAPRPPAPYTDDPRTLRPVEPYNPWSTLAPQYWLPVLFGDPRGPVVGIATSGADVVGRHRYAVQVGHGIASGEPTISAAYANRAFYPSLDFGAFTGIFQAGGFPPGWFDRHWGASGSVGLPFSRADASASASIGYEWRAYVPKYSATFAPDDPRPPAPRAGTTGTLGLGFTFSNSRRFADAISPEEGHLLTLGIRRSSRELGGSFEFASADARYHGYFALPWFEHHAVALRLALGAAVGDLGNRAIFYLGGIALRDPLLQLLYGGRAGPGYLRGFSPGALAGNSYVLLNAEYRFPIAVVDRGLDTVPFFIKRIYGAAFSDAGAVGPGSLELGKPRMSLGAEVRAELSFGGFAATELRVGLARGLAREGLWDLYVTLGSSY